MKNMLLKYCYKSSFHALALPQNQKRPLTCKQLTVNKELLDLEMNIIESTNKHNEFLKALPPLPWFFRLRYVMQ